MGCIMHVTLLGRVTLIRGAVAYSDQTFPWTICRSVRRFVQCIRIRMPFGVIGRTGPGMRQVVGFEDRSTGRSTFGGEFIGRAIVTNGDLFSQTYFGQTFFIVCDETLRLVLQ